MARINLLPWRVERRKQRQKEFNIMLVIGALGGVLLWFLVNSYYNGQIAGQNERNAFLDQKIQEVDKNIKEIEELDKKKARLLSRKKVIEQLQSNRSQMVHLFDSLVRTIPDGVVLTGLKQEGEMLTLEGRSQSNARVSTYIGNLESSGWMTKPDLSIIEAKEGDAGLPYMFSLKVTLANPNAPQDTNGDGVPDAAPAPAAPAAQLPMPAPMPTPVPAAAAGPTAAAATPAQPAAKSPEAAEPAEAAPKAGGKE